MIAVDTNVISYLLIESEQTKAVTSAFAADPDWIAPAHWRAEFLNVLSSQVRFRNLTVERAARIFARALLIVRDDFLPLDAGIVLTLSKESQCTAYDCLFVALAERERVRLLTFDRKILTAFPQIAESPA